jgi:hypothetical protein
MDISDTLKIIFKHLSYESISFYRQICSTWNKIILELITRPFKKMPFDLNHCLPYVYLQKIKLRHFSISAPTIPISTEMYIVQFFQSLNQKIKHFPDLKEIDLTTLCNTPSAILINYVYQSCSNILDVNCVEVLSNYYIINGEAVFLPNEEWIICTDSTNTRYAYRMEWTGSHNIFDFVSGISLEKIQLSIKPRNFQKMIAYLLPIRRYITKLDVVLVKNMPGPTKCLFTTKIVSLFPNLIQIKIHPGDITCVDYLNLKSVIKLKESYMLDDVAKGESLKMLHHVRYASFTDEDIFMIHEHYLKNYFFPKCDSVPSPTELCLTGNLFDMRMHIDFFRKHILKSVTKLMIKCEDLEHTVNNIPVMNILHAMLKNSLKFRLKKLFIRLGTDFGSNMTDLVLHQSNVILHNETLTELNFGCAYNLDRIVTLDLQLTQFAKRIPPLFFRYYRIYYQEHTPLNVLDSDPVRYEIKLRMIRRLKPLAEMEVGNLQQIKQIQLQAINGELILCIPHDNSPVESNADLDDETECIPMQCDAT